MALILKPDVFAVKAKNGKSMFLEDLYKVAIDEWGIGIYTPQVSTLEEREFYSYIGTSDAPYTGGFMNTFNYKSWELNLTSPIILGLM